MPHDSRHGRAVDLAAALERYEHHPILTSASIEAIHRTLSDYAVDCLSAVRQDVIAHKLDAVAKYRVLELLADAIEDETR